MYESIRECMGFHVLGSTGKLADYEMVVAIGNAQIRQRIMNRVDAVNGKIATVDHECRISDYVHVLVGAHLAGSVVVGERSWVGNGAVVSNNLTVCADCMIGAGAVVVNGISRPGTYIGIPARLQVDI